MALRHHLGSMNLNGDFASPEVRGNLLIEQSGNLCSAKTKYASRNALFQRIFVMQTAQDMLDSDLAIAWQSMSLPVAGQEPCWMSAQECRAPSSSGGVLYYSEPHKTVGFAASAAGSVQSRNPGTLVVLFRSAFRNVHSPVGPEQACAALSTQR